MKKMLVIFLLLIMGTTLIGCDKIVSNTPSLIGEADITIEIGDSFIDPGTDFEDDDNILITGEVNSFLLGTYVIEYEIEYKDNVKVTLTRTVHVVDTTPPVITLIGGDVTINQGEKFIEPGYTVYDNVNGELKTEVYSTELSDTSIPGEYIIQYFLEDYSGNSALVVSRIVTILESDTIINTQPVISLIGDETITITVGDSFTDPGATALDTEDGDLTNIISKIGVVNTTIAGTYTIEYFVTDSDSLSALSIIRTIHVIEVGSNEIPVITLIGDAEMTINVGDSFTDPGATATDVEDGDLTEFISTTGVVNTTTAGTYIIEYFVSDFEQNSALLVIRTVHVIDASTNDAPIITLIGNADITISVGSTFTDPGATATDTEDGDLTDLINTTGVVNTTTAGTYTIEYSVSDFNQNLATVTRTVTVVEVENNTYNTVYIEQNTDVNWDELEIDLGIANGSLTVDVTTLGTTSQTINSNQISFIVFDSSDELVIDINSIIIVPTNLTQTQYKMYVSIPSKQLVDIYLRSNMDSTFTLGKANLENDVLTLALDNTSISESAILDQGIYTLEFSSYAYEDGNYKIKLSTNPDWTSTNMSIPQNDVLNSYLEDENQDYTFTITEGDVYELALHSDSAFLVTITNESDQTIIERESYIFHYHYQEFYIFQTFSPGTYNVNVTFLDSPSTLKTFLTKGFEHSNLGYIVAADLPLDTPENIIVLPDRDWYQIDVETDGFYTFDIKYATGFLGDFYIYDSNLKQLSYTDTLQYLETGTYYLYFSYFIGEAIIEINSLESNTGSNNSLNDATYISTMGEYTVSFDKYNTEKWYSFALSDTSIINIYSSFEFYNGSADITLYDSGMNEIEDNIYQFTKQLLSGTYYLEINGTQLSVTQFTIEEKSCVDIVASATNPSLLGYNTPVTTYLDYEEIDYYSLIVDQSNLTEFIYTGNTFITMTLYKNGSLVETIDLYPNDRYVSSLSIGTYTIELQSNIESTIYNFEAKELDQSSSLWSTSKETANEINLETSDLLYVDSEDVSVYKQITLTEVTSLYYYLLNTKSIRIYNSSNEVVHEGIFYQLFPIALDVGTYTFELVSYGPGYIGFSDLKLNPIENFGGDFTHATVLPDVHGIKGYNSNLETVDVMKFTVDVETTYAISLSTSDREATYQILNGDKEIIITDSHTGISYYTFESGTYYIIVNNFVSYYEIRMENIELKLVGTSFETATEIYPMVYYEKVHRTPFDETYFTFTIEENGFFSFEYPSSQYYIELYDQSYNIYSSSYLTAGTYYLKAYHVEECNNTCLNQELYLKVENITGKIFNNDITEAINLLENASVNGIIVENTQVDWLTFNINENSIVQFSNYSYNYNTDFELYSLNGSTPELITSIDYTELYLESGIYYIKVSGLKGEYTFGYEASAYTQVGDSISEALALDTDTLTIDQIIKDEFDVDFYSFTVDEAGYYQIDTSFSSAYYLLYDSNGDRIYDNYGNDYYELTTDTYYVGIYNDYGFSTYTLQIINRDSYFGGDSFLNAKLVEPNGYYTGFAIDTDIDVYYTFTITENTYLEVSTYLNYKLFDSDTIEIVDYNLTPGTYYLKLTTYSSYDTYNFSLTSILLSNIINNTTDTPVIIEDTFFSISSQLHFYGQEDWYEFTIDSPQYYQIDNVGTNNLISIYNSEGVRIKYLSYYFTEEIYLPEGTYQIKIAVNMGYGNYEINFSNFEYRLYPNNKENAYDLFLYEHINGCFFELLDEAWFVFTIDSAKLIDLWTPNNYGHYILTNANDPDTQIFSNKQGLFFLEAGTYYIQKSNFMTTNIIYDFVWRDYTSNLLSDSPTNSLQVPVYDEFYYIEGYHDGTNDAYISFTLQDNATMVYKLTYDILDYEILNSSLVPVTTNQLSPGTYYVRFYDLDGGIASTQFEFALRNIKQLNHPESPTTPIVINQFIEGYTSSNSELDVFTITPTEDTLITIKLFNSNDQNFIIKLLDGTILFNYSINQGNSEYYELELTADTAYIIETTGIEGYYQFVVYSN